MAGRKKKKKKKKKKMKNLKCTLEKKRKIFRKILLFLQENMYSSQVPWGGASNEYSHALWRNKKNTNNHIALLNTVNAIFFVLKNKKDNQQEAHRATGRSPEWHSECRYADVMQHFSNPVIATNEKIII